LPFFVISLSVSGPCVDVAVKSGAGELMVGILASVVIDAPPAEGRGASEHGVARLPRGGARLGFSELNRASL
jgi:hypothetical protein